MKAKQLIIFALLCCLTAGSQSQLTGDSLKTILYNSPNDTNKINSLLKLAGQFDMTDPKNRVQNYMYALHTAKKIKHTKVLKKIYSPLITCLYINNMYNLALSYGNEYIDYCEKNKLNDDKYAIYNLMGNLLSRKEMFVEAKKYYLSKQNYDLQTENFKAYASSLNNLSSLFVMEKKYDSAYVYSLWAAEIYKRNNMAFELANTLMDIGVIQLKNSEFEKAEAKANEALSFYTVNNNKNGICNSLYLLASVYADKNQPDSAFRIFSKSILYADTLNLINLQRDCYRGLAVMYNKLKNYKDAYEYQVLAENYQDSVTNNLTNSKLLEVQLQNNLIKKENEEKNAEYEVKVKSSAKTFLLLSVLCFILLGAVVFRSITKK